LYVSSLSETTTAIGRFRLYDSIKSGAYTFASSSSSFFGKTRCEKDARRDVPDEDAEEYKSSMTKDILACKYRGQQHVWQLFAPRQRRFLIHLIKQQRSVYHMYQRSNIPLV
jgi:hypothetical protein